MLPRLASILPRIEGAEQTFSSLLFFQFVFNQKLPYLFFMQTSAITEISLVVFHMMKNKSLLLKEKHTSPMTLRFQLRFSLPQAVVPLIHSIFLEDSCKPKKPEISRSIYLEYDYITVHGV
jgi:hypothetical protein